MAFLVALIFEQDVLYLFRRTMPGQRRSSLGGTESNYDIPWTWSLVSVVAMNVLSLYLLANRVASMEVTRE